MAKQNKVETHGFFPHRPRFDIPHPLSFGTMPFSFQRCTVVAGCGFILFDVRIYMMPTIMCWIARYTIDNYPYCRNIHNQIDGEAFSFSSSPRLITLYTSCKGGQNWGVTFATSNYILLMPWPLKCYPVPQPLLQFS